MTLQTLLTCVRESDKQRFEVAGDSRNNPLYIRACQGHTSEILDDDKVFGRPLRADDESVPAVFYHGTSWSARESIQEKGLIAGFSHSGAHPRIHVHFSPFRPGDGEERAGMRFKSEIYFQIDAKGLIRSGLSVFRSSAGAILTRGPVLPRHIVACYETRTHRPVWFNSPDSATIKLSPQLRAEVQAEKPTANVEPVIVIKEGTSESVSAGREARETAQPSSAGAASSSQRTPLPKPMPTAKRQIAPQKIIIGEAAMDVDSEVVSDDRAGKRSKTATTESSGSESLAKEGNTTYSVAKFTEVDADGEIVADYELLIQMHRSLMNMICQALGTEDQELRLTPSICMDEKSRVFVQKVLASLEALRNVRGYRAILSGEFREEVELLKPHLDMRFRQEECPRCKASMMYGTIACFRCGFSDKDRMKAGGFPDEVLQEAEDREEEQVATLAGRNAPSRGSKSYLRGIKRSIEGEYNKECEKFLSRCRKGVRIYLLDENGSRALALDRPPGLQPEDPRNFITMEHRRFEDYRDRWENDQAFRLSQIRAGRDISFCDAHLEEKRLEREEGIVPERRQVGERYWQDSLSGKYGAKGQRGKYAEEQARKGGPKGPASSAVPKAPRSQEYFQKGMPSNKGQAPKGKGPQASSSSSSTAPPWRTPEQSWSSEGWNRGWGATARSAGWEEDPQRAGLNWWESSWEEGWRQ